MANYSNYKLSILAGLLLTSCSSNSDQQSNACVKAVASETIKTSSFSDINKTLGFYSGSSEFKYDKDLAEVVFAYKSDKLNSDRLKNSDPFECRVFFVISDKDYIDAWSARHCMFETAVRATDESQAVTYKMYIDGNDPIILKKDIPLMSAWTKVGEGIATLKSANIGDEIEATQEKIREFTVRFLHHNAYNSKLYTMFEQSLDLNLYRAFNGEESRLNTNVFGKALPYYDFLASKTNQEQIFLGRDICSTDYQLNVNDTVPVQQNCFSITDMTLTQIPKPDGFDKKYNLKPSHLFSNDKYKDSYKKWRTAHLNLNDAISKFIISEAVFRASKECLAVVGKDCPFSNGIDKFVDAAAELDKAFQADNKTSNWHSKVSTIRSTIENAINPSDPQITDSVTESRLQLLEAYNDLGLGLNDIRNSLSQDYKSLILAGAFKTDAENQTNMGYIDLHIAGQNAKSTIVFDQRPDGYLMLNDKSDLKFEMSDSGSLIWINGFPVATLSTVDGKSSSGGLATVYRPVTGTAGDIVPPEDILDDPPIIINPTDPSSSNIAENDTNQNISDSITIAENQQPVKNDEILADRTTGKQETPNQRTARVDKNSGQNRNKQVAQDVRSEPCP